MRAPRLTAGCTLLLLIGAVAQADEPSPEEIADLSLEELMDVDVTTSTASVQKQIEVPSTIYLITREMIIQRQYFDLQRLLEDIPEIQLDRSSNVEWEDVFTIRGIRGNQKFIIFLDGVRVSFETGGLHSVSQSFSLANAERVEVLLGPASALYGADAFSGVVNIITRSGGDVDGGALLGSFGRFDTTLDTFVAGGKEGDVSLSVTGSLYHSGEPNLATFYPEEFAWYRQRYVPFGQVRVSPSAPPDQVVTVPVEPYAIPRDANFFHVRLDVGRLQASYARFYEGHSTARPAKPEFSLYVEDARWEWAIQSLSLMHTWDSPKETVRLRTLLSLNTYDVLPKSKYMNAFSGYRAAFKYESNTVVQFEERATWRPRDWLSFAGGFVYEDVRAFPKTSDLDHPFDPDVAASSQGYVYPGSDVVDTNGRDLSIPVDFFDVNFHNVGVYAELFTRPHDLVAVTVGERVDNDSRFGVTYNPRVGVVFLPGDTRLRFQFGQASLAPPPYLAYAHFVTFFPVTDASGGIVGLESPFASLPNPDLKPERLTSLELSALQKIGGWGFQARGFYNRVSDVHRGETLTDQTFKGWPIAIVERWANRGQLATWGGTLAFRAVLEPGDFEVNPWLAYTYIDGKTDDGQGDDGPLLGVVKNSLKGGVDASYGDLSLSTRVNFRGDADSPAQVDAEGQPLEIPSSWIVNVDARWADAVTPGGVGITPFVSIQNLFDARNFHVSDGTETFAGAPQDPFRILGGLAVTY